MDKRFTYLLTILNLFGCWLNIEKNPWCWPFWIITSLGFGWYMAEKKEYGTASLFGFYALIDGYGWWVWSR